MNGLLALCHFCELHGPSVIFCTQAFHLHGGATDLSAPNAAQAFANANTVPPSAAAQADLDNAARAAAQIPPTTATAEALHSSVSEGGHALPKPTSACPACASLPDHERGYITNDYEAKTTYLSTRNPIHPKLYAIVRQACVRSLSCEFSPGREGPVLFGDELNGNVLSYMFKIRDSQARGMQRWYCFILLMTDRIHLVASWPFLVNNFRHIANDCQQKAERTYDRELTSRRKMQESSLGGPVPRMATFQSAASDQFLRRRGTQSLRHMSELMGSADFFGQLHAYCSWLLRSCGNRLYEKQLSGPPLLATTTEPPAELSFLENETSDNARGFLSQYLDTAIARNFAHLRFESLTELRKILRPEAFSTLINNVVIGNQIVVRGEVFSVVESILLLLRELVPPSCCNVVLYDNVYHESYSCNFLGLHSSADIPNYVDRNTFVLLDIKFDAYDDYVSGGSGSFANHDQQIERFRQFFFLVSNNQIRSRSASTIRRNGTSGDLQQSAAANTLTTQLDAVLALNPSPSLLDVQLMIIKEEWIAKTKLFFKFARSLEGENEDKVKKFVKALGLKENDIAVLRYWTTGLNRRYRARLLVS